MDKTITTALLIVVSMIMVVMLFNAVYPAVQQGGEAVTSMANGVADRMRNQISTVHASANFDETGICPNTGCAVLAWVKNIGQDRIIGINRMDIFFGPEGNFTRIPYDTEANGAYPYWSSSVVNGTEWVPTGTLQITIHYQLPPSHGRYFFKATLPNGLSSDYFLGL